ncbi:AAA family ATPase [Acinetobacter bereziniae]|uniref:AAA family ATPase n=1 Tax=Acinetobacter bereziniae TaxID=106648 RepID=UPI002954A762|nr:AAA family ATPase [Acinetobacter bereziniae]MDV8158143.1 AAA family ATPase [Acinetobacter bereziniae]
MKNYINEVAEKMFIIKSVKIDGFWHRMTGDCSFFDDVNIIIGRNGTGKTTFMNILHSILMVDTKGLAEDNFEKVEIILKEGNRTKTIKVKRLPDNEIQNFLFFEYQISNKKYTLRTSPEDILYPSTLRRRLEEESSRIRSELREIVLISSLSVYRLRNSSDYEIRDKTGKHLVSPIDFKLSELLQGLTTYQLELTQQVNLISSKLQKDVLASILYTEKRSFNGDILQEFNQDRERESLTSAFRQLKVYDIGFKTKINEHVKAVDKTISLLNSENHEIDIDYSALDALVRSRIVVDLSLKAEREISRINSHLDLFINILEDFIQDKKFEIKDGQLNIKNNKEFIHYNKMSSGEKQLLILFIETLLQKNTNNIFLTDEPELSLHIEWQRKIIPAIQKLNPNAQIIAATHSPEVASKYSKKIISMSKIVHV